MPQASRCFSTAGEANRTWVEGVKHTESKNRVYSLSYLDLVHVHDGPGGSLRAQAEADALVQRHAVELAVISCSPPAWEKRQTDRRGYGLCRPVQCSPVRVCVSYP